MEDEGPGLMFSKAFWIGGLLSSLFWLGVIFAIYTHH